MTVATEFDRRHPVEQPGDLFGIHRLDIFGQSPEFGTIGLVCQVGIVGGQASYTALFLDRSRQVVVHETEIEAPRQGWELRASGLWAEQTCETSLSHWSYGLEAFGLDLDDPQALLGRAFGDRVPIGWDFEFEASSDATWLSSFGPDASSAQGRQAQGRQAQGDGYVQQGAAHGLVLDTSGSHEFSGQAVRSHWWAGLGPDRLTVGAGQSDESPGLAEIWVPGVTPHEDAGPWPWRTRLSTTGLRSERRHQDDPGGRRPEGATR